MNALDLTLIADGKVTDVSAAVTALHEPDRPAAFKTLESYVKRHPDLWYGAASTALAVATVGTAPSAAAAARILRHRNFTSVPGTAAAVLATARARGVPWLPDLAGRLDEMWPVAAELVATGALPPPPADWFVLGWLDHLNYPDEERLRATSITDRLRTDPLLDALLPRLFTTDQAGDRLLLWPVRGRPGGKLALIEALAALSSEGRLNRAALIAATLSRLVRATDRRPATRAYLALLAALSPTPDEVSSHAADYLRLLSDAQVTVAGVAQKALRTAPGLDLDALLEASRAVLHRPEKALVKAQLSWLAALTREHPGRAPDIAAALAEGLDHPAIELRERAAALVSVSTPASASHADGARGDDLPPPPPVAPAPPPITDVDELAEEVAAFYSDRPFTALLPMERILDAVVRLAATDRPALQAALGPVLERHREGMGDHRWDPNCLCGTFTHVLQTAADPTQAPSAASGWAALLAAARRFLSLGESTPDRRVPPLQRLLRARLAEIGLHLGSSKPSVNTRPSSDDSFPAGGLLSAPTSSNGALDTAVLLDRLAASGDGEPWSWDLAQAMLRLPPGPDPDSAARAEALGTRAGSRLAAWLRDGGLPTPGWRVEVWRRQPKKFRGGYGPYTLPTARVEVTTAPPDASRPSETFGLFGTAPPPVGPGSNGWHVLWPGMLPWHRGLVAAFALPDAAATADMDQRGGAAVLPLLAEAGGECGPGLPIAIAYALTARHEPDRLAAVDALLLLAATGSSDAEKGRHLAAPEAPAPEVSTHGAPTHGSSIPGAPTPAAPVDGSFDAETAGHYLGLLAVGGAVKVSRAVQPLRDAASAGAPRSVFRLLAAALPSLLAAPTPPPGTPDLLTLAAETAGARPGPVVIEGLEVLAARKGSSRLVTEGRRLAGALAEPA